MDTNLRRQNEKNNNRSNHVYVKTEYLNLDFNQKEVHTKYKKEKIFGVKIVYAYQN